MIPFLIDAFTLRYLKMSWVSFYLVMAAPCNAGLNIRNSSVWLTKLPNLTSPFPHLWNGDNHSPSLTGMSWVLISVCQVLWDPQMKGPEEAQTTVLLWKASAPPTFTVHWYQLQSALNGGNAAFRHDKASFIGPLGHAYLRELVLWKWLLCQGLLF